MLLLCDSEQNSCLFFFSAKTCRKQPEAFKLEPLARKHHTIIFQDDFDSSCRFWLACSSYLASHKENFPCPKSYSLPFILSPLVHILFKTQIILCQPDTDCPPHHPAPWPFLFLSKRGKEISLRKKLSWFLSSVLTFLLQELMFVYTLRVT